MGQSLASVAESIDRIERMLLQATSKTETVMRGSDTNLSRSNIVELIDQELRMLDLRRQFLPHEFSYGAGWRVLLVVSAAQLAQRGVKVTNVCNETGFSSTTTLRYIANAIDQGLLEKEDDLGDGRLKWLRISKSALRPLIAYFGKIADDRLLAGSHSSITHKADISNSGASSPTLTP